MLYENSPTCHKKGEIKRIYREKDAEGMSERKKEEIRKCFEIKNGILNKIPSMDHYV